MDTRCKGENCTSTDGRGHSVECQFQHFLAYTGFASEPDEVIAKLKMAYLHGAAGDTCPSNDLDDAVRLGHCAANVGDALSHLAVAGEGIAVRALAKLVQDLSEAASGQLAIVSKKAGAGTKAARTLAELAHTLNGGSLNLLAHHEGRAYQVSVTDLTAEQVAAGGV